MNRPKMLDLFCGQGGAAVGYHRAGWDVFGVDLDPQSRYPFEFVQGDALTFLFQHGHEFDAIHASPPCQGYSTITPDQSKHERLIEPTRELLADTGRPYVIENVAGARKHLIDPIQLCGSTFDLSVRRHRLFESNIDLTSPGCRHAGREVIGVYGDHPDSREFFRPDGTRRGRKATSDTQASEALGGVEWMSWHGMTECVPPAFTQHIGAQLINHLALEMAA